MELSEFQTETEATMRLAATAAELREATLFEAEAAVLARQADLVHAEFHAEQIKIDLGKLPEMCTLANQRIAHADEAAAKARVSMLSAQLRALGLRRNCA